MASLDPYVQEIPAAFRKDPEVLRWFQYDNRWKHDIGYAVTGGGTGTVPDAESATTFYDGTQGDVIALQGQLEDNFVSPPIIPHFHALIKSQNYTAIDWDFVEARNGATITLPQYPGVDTQIIVANGDGTKIVVDGNGNKIKTKKLSDSVNVRNHGSSYVFHWFNDGSYWRII
jgi:hypothetical protein